MNKHSNSLSITMEIEKVEKSQLKNKYNIKYNINKCSKSTKYFKIPREWGLKKWLNGQSAFYTICRKKHPHALKKKKKRKKNFKNVLIFETKSQPCSPGWPGTHYANTPYPMF